MGKRGGFGWPAAVAAVAVILGGLLVGVEPVGGDPDALYRPIKEELGRQLRDGTLPLWSDRFGLGVPLAAESHVAAFYPPNWLLFGLLPMPIAYRLSLWLHELWIVGATYLYARRLGIAPEGAALGGLAFALCGFQASHACHEPFYHVVPYLPLALLLADRYAESGRLGWLAGLALTLGVQLTLGHFQLQAWTCALAVALGTWRVVADGRPLVRAAGLLAAPAWGGAIAALQVAPTLGLLRAGGGGDAARAASYAFPPEHWAQAAFPRLFLGLGRDYWSPRLSTPADACLWVGTAPLILAFVGLVGPRRDRALAPWRAVAILAAIWATLPLWWPDAFRLVAAVPILGSFRAPGRAVLLIDLWLCLLAGRGLDRAIAATRARAGVALALAFGIGAAGWAWWWYSRYAPKADPAAAWAIAAGAPAWLVALATLAAWRRGRVGAWAPASVTAVELAVLFYRAPATTWGWSVDLPRSSPALTRLAAEPGVELVAGPLDNVPARAGLTPAWPYFGIAPPPPNYLLERSRSPDRPDPGRSRWLRRLGVSHGLWRGPVSWGETIATLPDPSLDRLGLDPGPAGPWSIVRLAPPFPRARAATTLRVADDWPSLYSALASRDDPSEAWFLAADRPPTLTVPRAQRARVTSFDGRSARVDHDGSCILVIRRTFDPGWLARVNSGAEHPVLPADGGLQAIPLAGPGPTLVTLRYRPRLLRPALLTSALATSLALLVLTSSARRRPPKGER
ncbi:MAG TPA: hypothetical protein VG406_22995 [Isosphaeraceae bacterium]|jgi:hypothetical protein|nr:hypothetical protein [Isosphaeraceae bacterium]